MFQGFQQKLPEYEIMCPQSRRTFTVKSMNIAEEEKLKGSFMFSAKMLDHLNKCLFDSTIPEKRPEDIQTYSDFLEKISVIDRQAILFGLYHITYGEIRNYEVGCESCEKTYSITTNTKDIFSIKLSADDKLMEKTFPANLEIFSKIVVYVKQPSLKEEFDAMNAYAPNLSGESLAYVENCILIDKIEEFGEDGEILSSYNTLEDIMDGFKTLPSKDKRKIQEVYKEKFGDFSVNLKMKSRCTFCGHEEDLTIDLVSQFFRMVQIG